MPEYEYMDEQGNYTSRIQPFSESVEIETWTVIDGVRLKRIASIPQLSVAPELRVTGYTMANDHPSIDAVGLKRDADGNPLFDGKRDIERFNADSQRQNEKDPDVQAYGWD